MPDPIPDHAVWIGYQPILDELFPDIDFAFTHQEEVLIAANEDHLVIAGRDRWDEDHLIVEGRNRTIEGWQREYGTVNAVYTFLRDHLDVRWIMPGEFGEDVIQSDTIAVGPLEYRHHPPFLERAEILRFSKDGDSRRHSHDWARFQRVQLDSVTAPGGHPASDWWEKYHESHPDYFALQPDGSRSGYPSPANAKRCLSNPAVWDQWLKEVEQILEKDPNRTVFSGSENDSHSSGLCVCENCREWDPSPEETPETSPYGFWFSVISSRMQGGYMGNMADYLGPPSEEFRERSDLVTGGQPHAEILIAEDPPRSVKLAARELQTYLKKITGATLEIVVEPTGKVPGTIYVGESPYAERAGVTAEGLAHDAFRMLSGDNWLALVGHDEDFTPIEPWARSRSHWLNEKQQEWDVLAGGYWKNPVGQSLEVDYRKDLDLWRYDRRGSLNAVHEFLRSLGVRWYMPGEVGEVLPETDTVALPEIDRMVEPEIEVRTMNFARFGRGVSTEDCLWYLRLGTSREYGVMHHGMRYLTEHPDLPVRRLPNPGDPRPRLPRLVFRLRLELCGPCRGGTGQDPPRKENPVRSVQHLPVAAEDNRQASRQRFRANHQRPAALGNRRRSPRATCEPPAAVAGKNGQQVVADDELPDDAARRVPSPVFSPRHRPRHP